MNRTKEQKRKSNWLFYRRRLRFRIFRRDRFTCQFCGAGILDGAQITLDHIIPVSAGGDYLAENLITACLSCNQGKGNDALSDWETQNLKRECEHLQVRGMLILA